DTAKHYVTIGNQADQLAATVASRVVLLFLIGLAVALRHIGLTPWKDAGVFVLHHYRDLSNGSVASSDCQVARHDLVATKTRAFQSIFTEAAAQMFATIVERTCVAVLAVISFRSAVAWLVVFIVGAFAESPASVFGATGIECVSSARITTLISPFFRSCCFSACVIVPFVIKFLTVS